MENLKSIGWCDFFEKEFEPYRKQGFEVGRVAVENKDCYLLLSAGGEVIGEASGKLLFAAESTSDLPKVGDWVVLSISKDERKAVIHEVLARRTKFSRKVAGKQVREQILTTNIDVIFIVQSLDGNYSLRRLERTLVLVHESGAEPIVVLNKADLCDSAEERLAEVQQIVKDVLVVSCKTNQGISRLKSCIKGGSSFAFIGSTGVGKSTLINKIVGADVQKTAEVRAWDSKGRHTTTRRELLVLPEGGCLIDTPGMRELQLWNADEGMTEAFAEIEALAGNCRFSDCSHTKEIDCAVKAALQTDQLAHDRYESYVKLQRELQHLGTKQSLSNKLQKKKREKELHKMYKRIQKEKRKVKRQR